MAKGLKTGGRQKGTPNKTTQAVKDVIASVAMDLGGSERMLEWVREDPLNERMFWKDIYPKLLPIQVNGDINLKMTLVERLKALSARA